MNNQTCFSATDLLDADIPEIPHYVENLIVPGCTLLAGAPKAGKSYLSFYLGYQVAIGDLVFGVRPSEETNVLYLALEDNPARMQKRLSEIKNATLLGQYKKPDNLTFKLSAASGSNDSVTELKKLIRKHKSKVVFIDIFTRMFNPEKHVGGYRGEYKMMKSIKDVADETGTAIVVLHHTNKTKSKNVMDNITGSRGLTGACDNYIIMNESGPSKITLHARGRDLDDQILTLEYGTPGAFYKFVESEDPVMPEPTKAAQALELHSKGMKQVEIARKLNCSQGYISKLLKKAGKEANNRDEP